MKLIKQANPLQIVAILLTLAFITYYSCRRIDYSEIKREAAQKVSKFFNIPYDTDPVVKALSKKIKGQDEEHHFVSELVDRAGYAKWNKSLVVLPPSTASRGSSEDSSITWVYIPFADSMVKAVLIAGITPTDTLFRLLNDYEYKYFNFDSVQNGPEWNARNMFAVFAYFQQEIFNTSRYTILDHRLFALTDTTQNALVTFNHDPIAQRHSRGTLVEYKELCWEVDVCYAPSQPAYIAYCGGVCTEGCQYWQWQYDECVGFWVESGGWGGGSSSQPPFIPQGGYTGNNGAGNTGSNPGGGGYWWPNFCQNGTYCSSPGWHPVLVPDEIPYNPLIADTIGISDVLRDSFPCIYAFLNDSLRNANVMAQLAGADIFKDSAYCHLSFLVSTTDTTRNDAAAYTWSPTTPAIGGDGMTYADLLIELNPYFLKNSPLEFTRATIIHEILHAVFVIRWAQYQKWLFNHSSTNIDSNYLKSRFGLYWYYLTQAYPGATPLQEHEIMANAYVDTMRSILNNFWNPAATGPLRDSVIKAMCWEGLYKTTAWKNLPAYGVDTCYYKAINYCAAFAETGAGYNIPNCGNYYLHYVDSLMIRPPCH